MNIKDFATRWALHYVNPDFLKIPFNNESGGAYYYYPIEFTLTIPEILASRLANPDGLNNFSVQVYLYYYDNQGNKKFLKIVRRNTEQDINYVTFRDIEDGENKQIDLYGQKYVFIISKDFGDIYVQENYIQRGKIHLEHLQLKMSDGLRKQDISPSISYNQITHVANYIQVKIASSYDMEIPAAEKIGLKSSTTSIGNTWYLPGFEMEEEDSLPEAKTYFSYLPSYNNNINKSFQMTIQENPPEEVITNSSGYRLVHTERIFEEAEETSIGLNVYYITQHEEPLYIGWSNNQKLEEDGKFQSVTVCHLKTTENQYYYKEYRFVNPSYFINGVSAYLPKSVSGVKRQSKKGSKSHTDATSVNIYWGFHYYNDGPGTKPVPPGIWTDPWEGPYVARDDKVMTVSYHHVDNSYQSSDVIETTDFDGTYTKTESASSQLWKHQDTTEVGRYYYQWTRKYTSWLDIWSYMCAEVSVSSIEKTEGDLVIDLTRYSPGKTYTSSQEVKFTTIVSTFATAISTYLIQHPEELIVGNIKYSNLYSPPLDNSSFNYYGTVDLDSFYLLDSERLNIED